MGVDDGRRAAGCMGAPHALRTHIITVMRRSRANQTICMTRKCRPYGRSVHGPACQTTLSGTALTGGGNRTRTVCGRERGHAAAISAASPVRCAAARPTPCPPDSRPHHSVCRVQLLGHGTRAAAAAAAPAAAAAAALGADGVGPADLRKGVGARVYRVHTARRCWVWWPGYGMLMDGEHSATDAVHGSTSGR